MRLYFVGRSRYGVAMPDDAGFDRTVRAAIRTHQLICSHGTPAMQFLSRLLLMEIGLEIAARDDSDRAANDNPDATED
ncbi:hypothetical protein MKK88_14475 [Methylobacterium sp. E-005]|uniref:hypothetical protein n=1 Tax=Methylobacterium sp. E-005 TaxID=2836549 RepID=UPI001FB9F103|nr:hypothetical protein [Methylobacterium sp. E-005]MCJ2087182.1 hypothetical protein [Methylobacterium sp. E-005]